jgi:hypothetical protein
LDKIGLDQVIGKLDDLIQLVNFEVLIQEFLPFVLQNLTQLNGQVQHRLQLELINAGLLDQLNHLADQHALPVRIFNVDFAEKIVEKTVVFLLYGVIAQLFLLIQIELDWRLKLNNGIFDVFHDGQALNGIGLNLVDAGLDELESTVEFVDFV